MFLLITEMQNTSPGFQNLDSLFRSTTPWSVFVEGGRRLLVSPKTILEIKDHKTEPCSSNAGDSDIPIALRGRRPFFQDAVPGMIPLSANSAILASHPTFRHSFKPSHDGSPRTYALVEDACLYEPTPSIVPSTFPSHFRVRRSSFNDSVLAFCSHLPSQIDTAFPLQIILHSLCTLVASDRKSETERSARKSFPLFEHGVLLEL